VIAECVNEHQVSILGVFYGGRYYQGRLQFDAEE